MFKYRELFPNASVGEYSYKKTPNCEKVIRCIRLKCKEEKENSEKLEKKATEGNFLSFL